MTPGVGAVQCHIDGKISQDLYPLFGCVIFDCLPLAVEHILQEAVITDIIVQDPAPVLHGVRPAQADVFVPLHPCRVFKTALQRAVKGIVIQPFLVVCNIGLEGVAVCIVRSLCPFFIRMQRKRAVFISTAQKRITKPIDPVIVHVGGMCAEFKLIGFFSGEISRSDELLKIDKIGISREGRKRLIRRVTISGLPQGQDLPPGLAGFRKKVNETIGFRRKAADSVFRRKAGDRKQDTAGPFHGISSCKILTFFKTLSQGLRRYPTAEAAGIVRSSEFPFCVHIP